MPKRPIQLAALCFATVVASSGCAYSLPLGGIGVGRGRPIESRFVQLGVSGGRLPELAGTLPALTAPDGHVVNPVPDQESLTTSAGALDPIGLVVAVSDAADVGLSFSRGLHSVIRVARGPRWAVSVSPAVYAHGAREESLSLVGVENVGHVVNLNVTGLLSTDPWPSGPVTSDFYVGGGVSRFVAWLDAGERRSSHSAWAPTVLAGLRLGLPRCRGSCEAGSRRLWGLGLEVDGTWLKQRTGRSDFVPVARIFLALAVDRPR
jgi:hypothetical protein